VAVEVDVGWKLVRILTVEAKTSWVVSMVVTHSTLLERAHYIMASAIREVVISHSP
jgi:hypothetical protein